MKIILPILLLLLSQVAIAQPITPSTETSLPLQFNTGNPAPYGLPSTDIVIQGKTIPVIFDTGAKKSEVTLSRYALKNLHVKFTGKQSCSMALNGKICEPEFIIPEMTLGNFTLKNVKGTLMTKLWGGSEAGFKSTTASRDGVIGLALLSKFNVLLDYAHARAVLVKPGNSPSQYDVSSWITVPFSQNTATQLKVDGKTVTLVWDTGAVPSKIKQSVVTDLNKKPCTHHKPYGDNPNCTVIETTQFTTLSNKKLPNIWFMVMDMPAFVPFDGFIGSNFYQNNLVYFNFDENKIYIKPITK